ncbi:MAG TPA: thioredoxin fold domain-containing protein [Ideonella sp.]|jgi:thiol:disulfide interchange protein DsbG|nr:thioredoxin fold domain-containing protein [Ideonella sp.]
MQRRHFTLSTLAGLLGLAALAGCERKAETSPAAPAAAEAPSAPPAPASAAPAAPAASQAPAAAASNAYTLAATGHGFSIGPMMSAHTVYVFFDPACPHCAHLWANVQPLAKQLKIVWIPVGFLRPQSTPQGATILAAAEPAAAMAENEASVSQRGPGIAVGKPDEATLAQVKANTTLLQRLNADSVPLIVYRNGKTGEVGQQAGALEAAELLRLVGL